MTLHGYVIVQEEKGRKPIISSDLLDPYVDANMVRFFTNKREANKYANELRGYWEDNPFVRFVVKEVSTEI